MEDQEEEAVLTVAAIVADQLVQNDHVDENMNMQTY